MNENEVMTNVESQQENVGTNDDYIKAIKEMKATTVSREDYNKLREENKKLLQAVVNGETVEIEKQKPVDIKEIKKRMISAEASLDGISAALDLRDAIMAAGGDDPFLPSGKKVNVTDEDIRTAQKVADGFRHCVEYADGDPHIFANELSRITVDTGPVPRRKNKR